MSELSQVKGINARQIKLLQESGISSAEALAMSNTEIVSGIEGIGDKTAKKLIWNARSALGMSEFTPASEIDENVEFITTGSNNLNKILGGGVSTGKLTEVYGPFKSGKTNLSHTISVTVQLPKEQGGLNGSVVFIDTENTFSKDKIVRIAKRFELDPQDVLSKIYHARIYSSDHQIQMVNNAEILCKTKNVRLIIVDSLMALFRAEFVGIGMLARRQGMINNMIHALSRIAETYNCAILLTNQVMTKMMGTFSADDAIGGNIVAHGCHFRMMFKTKGFSANNSLLRRAIIVDAPDLPPEECEFYITSIGLADTDQGEFVPKLGEEGSEELQVEPVVEDVLEDIPPNQAPSPVPIGKVKGIGDATAKKFSGQGIKTASDLLNANNEQLSAKTGVPAKKIAEFKEAAKILTNS